MKGRPRSTTRHLTKTGHRPIPDPIPATNPDIGEPPADLHGVGREFWADFIADRTALGTVTRLDRYALTLACRALMRAERSANVARVETARRLLTELLATPATRLKIAQLAKPKPEAVQQPTTAIGRSLDLVIGGKRSG